MVILDLNLIIITYPNCNKIAAPYRMLTVS